MKEIWNVVGSTKGKYLTLTQDGVKFAVTAKDGIPLEDRINW